MPTRRRLLKSIEIILLDFITHITSILMLFINEIIRRYYTRLSSSVTVGGRYYPLQFKFMRHTLNLIKTFKINKENIISDLGYNYRWGQNLMNSVVYRQSCNYRVIIQYWIALCNYLMRHLGSCHSKSRHKSEKRAEANITLIWPHF